MKSEEMEPECSAAAQCLPSSQGRNPGLLSIRRGHSGPQPLSPCHGPARSRSPSGKTGLSPGTWHHAQRTALSALRPQ
ncbi:unnamed protein product [Rangifer tarandus platyrhynchus]|uniref:Uncharacterized protein n=1 Tax=Rangifer tarandus platyrhynchus TaxID=3082113 RepID=A0AC60A7J5_RANTA